MQNQKEVLEGESTKPHKLKSDHSSSSSSSSAAIAYRRTAPAEAWLFFRDGRWEIAMRRTGAMAKPLVAGTEVGHDSAAAFDPTARASQPWNSFHDAEGSPLAFPAPLRAPHALGLRWGLGQGLGLGVRARGAGRGQRLERDSRCVATMAATSTGALYDLLPSSALAATTPPLLVAVDGTALMFRSYFGMPPLSRSDGKEVGAVVGFCNTLVRLLLPYPVHKGGVSVLVTFDTAGPTFRNDIFEDYKAQRDAPPESLGPQFDLAYEACEAFGWATFSLPGYEADDIIATVAATASTERPVVLKFITSPQSWKGLRQKVQWWSCSLTMP